MKICSALVVVAALACSCLHTKQQVVPPAVGSVVSVNDEWNFVAFRRDSAYPVDKEEILFVQREDKIIGKIQVTQQTNDLWIADIMRIWIRPISVGDRVIGTKQP